MSPEMLTAKDIQEMLQVDRSTIYRMAESGRLPAIKVGKQWRFPRNQVETWLHTQNNVLQSPTLSKDFSGGHPTLNGDLASILPLDCVQLIQDAFAEILNVMLVITDIDGQPITQISNPSTFYNLLSETGSGHVLCQEKWEELRQIPALEPRFSPSLAGLLCARAFVRSENQLKGMVIVFGVAPKDWPPTLEVTTQLAQSFDVDPVKLRAAFEGVPQLTLAEQKRALVTIQRIADILAHIGNERLGMLTQLEGIAQLGLDPNLQTHKE
jgi:excisionase family DNA binding protein